MASKEAADNGIKNGGTPRPKPNPNFAPAGQARSARTNAAPQHRPSGQHAANGQPVHSGARPAGAAQRSASGRPAPQAVRKTGSGAKNANAAKPRSSQGGKQQHKKRRRKKSRAPQIALASVLCIAGAGVLAYFAGYAYYKDKFTANTFVNGVEVSGKTFAEASKLFEHDEVPDALEVIRPSGETVDIQLSSINYSYSYEKELKKVYDDIDRKSWFAALLSKTDYTFTDVASYDKNKLVQEMESSDWGSNVNENAKLRTNDDGYYIVPEVQGDVFDMTELEKYVIKCLDKGSYTVEGVDSGAYTAPDTVSGDLEAKLETLNKLWNVKIKYDFNYTKETLTGKQLTKMVHVKRDGSYTVDEDACMKYIEKLARKYDTYNTERKFKATIQGKITVPISSDAKYGWWLDQQQTCDQLVGLIKKGKTKKKVEPIYYSQGNYEFTGLASARSKNDDIGKTYLEVDLTNQQFWYYKKGKKIRSGYIVSGQTTSEARTTLPGVYKVWQKATNYRMKDSNADGDTWDTTCNYWNRIAIVGIGMHDSTWRGGAFGGDIYKYNGSHGCINMTYDDAKYIYDNVAMGTPVVMYY